MKANTWGISVFYRKQIRSLSISKQSTWIETADVWTKLAKQMEAWAEIQKKNIKPFVLNEIFKKCSASHYCWRLPRPRSYCLPGNGLLSLKMYVQNRNGRKTTPSYGSTLWEPCLCAQDLGKHQAANIEQKCLLLTSCHRHRYAQAQGCLLGGRAHTETHTHMKGTLSPDSTFLTPFPTQSTNHSCNNTCSDLATRRQQCELGGKNTSKQGKTPHTCQQC